MPHRPFRFGVQLVGAPSGQDWARQCQEAESLGYSSVLIPDHFGDELAPIPAIMAAAMATKTLRVGSLVFANDYKHPVVLAKEAATLDVLSGGRLELGIGAGWLASEYQQAGLPFDRPGLRIDRMVEAVAVLKGLMAPGPFTYQGTHYQVSDLNGTPKPVQTPHPPIIMGGGGRRMLTVAAQLADIIGLIPNLAGGSLSTEVALSPTDQDTAEKVAWIKAAAGDRYSHLELSILVFAAVVTPNPAPIRAKIAADCKTTPEALAHTPHVLIGDPSEIADTLQRRREQHDVSYVVVSAPFMHSFAPVVWKLAKT